MVLMDRVRDVWTSHEGRSSSSPRKRPVVDITLLRCAAYNGMLPADPSKSWRPVEGEVCRAESCNSSLRGCSSREPGRSKCAWL